MNLYHGSFTAVPTPDLSFCRDTTDFGKGFYTTTIQAQAEKWAARYKRRQGSGVVSVYEIDEGELRKNVPVLEFDTYSVEWLDFIIRCRRGEPGRGEPAGNYGIVIGGIANDDVFNTLTVFFRGFIDKTEAIKRLRYEKPNIQYCFKTQTVMDKYLIYKGNTAI
jgi:hypothetical protein